MNEFPLQNWIRLQQRPAFQNAEVSSRSQKIKEEERYSTHISHKHDDGKNGIASPLGGVTLNTQVPYQEMRFTHLRQW
jgi:hypothetical protein